MRLARRLCVGTHRVRQCGAEPHRAFEQNEPRQSIKPDKCWRTFQYFRHFTVRVKYTLRLALGIVAAINDFVCSPVSVGFKKNMGVILAPAATNVRFLRFADWKLPVRNRPVQAANFGRGAGRKFCGAVA